MIFLFIAILAVALYIWDYKIPALLLFFFFVTGGFNLIPEEMTEFGPISKASDYALLILFSILAIDGCCIPNYFRIDRLIKYLLIFGGFLLACIAYSKYSIGLSWVEIIRTCRYHFFWLAYFVFRQLDKKQLESLLRYLFDITVVISVLYLLQYILQQEILVHINITFLQLFGMKFLRYYNLPDMVPFFIFMAIYFNPHHGILKRVTTVILILSLFFTFHRSWISIFLCILIVAYVMKLSRVKQLRFWIITAIFGVLFGGFALSQFAQSRAYADLQNLSAGNYAEFADSDIDMDDLSKSTFTFRIAHFYERNEYIQEHPKAMVFGAGLLQDDSKQVDKLFDFKVGLLDELTGSTIQVGTGDISYSLLILQYGYVGTFLIMALLIYLMLFFYKWKSNPYAFFSFLYFIMTFGISLFSTNLIKPITFVLPLISYVILKKQNELSH
jgi:hypothetical protein